MALLVWRESQFRPITGFSDVEPGGNFRVEFRFDRVGRCLPVGDEPATQAKIVRPTLQHSCFDIGYITETNDVVLRRLPRSRP